MLIVYLKEHEVVKRVVPLHQAELIRTGYTQILVTIVWIPGRTTFNAIFNILITGFSILEIQIF